MNEQENQSRFITSKNVRMFQEKNKSINSLKMKKIQKVFSSNKQQVTQVWTCCFKIILKHEFLSYKIKFSKNANA